jgi:hypothetical protein
MAAERERKQEAKNVEMAEVAANSITRTLVAMAQSQVQQQPETGSKTAYQQQLGAFAAKQDAEWNSKMDDFETYMRTQKKFPTRKENFGIWVEQQKFAWKSNKLSSDRMSRLDGVQKVAWCAKNTHKRAAATQESQINLFPPYPTRLGNQRHFC